MRSETPARCSSIAGAAMPSAPCSTNETRDRDADMPNAVPLGRDRRGELGALPDDEVGPPALIHLVERREHRVDVQAGEDDADHDDVPLCGRQARHAAPERAEDVVGRRRSRRERIAARLERRRADDERLVPGAAARQRVDDAGCEEEPQRAAR